MSLHNILVEVTNKYIEENSNDEYLNLELALDMKIEIEKYIKDVNEEFTTFINEEVLKLIK